jgi:hypothetical protein
MLWLGSGSRSSCHDCRLWSVLTLSRLNRQPMRSLEVTPTVAYQHSLAFLRLYDAALEPLVEFITDYNPLTCRIRQYQQRPVYRPRYCLDRDYDYDVSIKIDRLQRSPLHSATGVPPRRTSHDEIFEMPSQNQRELATAADAASSSLRPFTNYFQQNDLLPLPTCPVYKYVFRETH